MDESKAGETASTEMAHGIDQTAQTTEQPNTPVVEEVQATASGSLYRLREATARLPLDKSRPDTPLALPPDGLPYAGPTTVPRRPTESEQRAWPIRRPDPAFPSTPGVGRRPLVPPGQPNGVVTGSPATTGVPEVPQRRAGERNAQAQPGQPPTTQEATEVIPRRRRSDWSRRARKHPAPTPTSPPHSDE